MLAGREDFRSIGALIPWGVAVDIDSSTGGFGRNLEHALALDLEVGAEPVARNKKCENRDK